MNMKPATIGLRFSSLLRSSACRLAPQPNLASHLLPRIYAQAHSYSSSSSSSTATDNATELRHDMRLHAYQKFDLILLGTGGSIPTKRRGLPSTVLNLGPENWIFDAAEGTLRQSIGITSMAETTKFFVTHLHLDHILGLASLISHSFNHNPTSNTSSDIDIYGPEGLYEYIVTTLKIAQYVPPDRKIIVHELVVKSNDLHIFHEKEKFWKGKKLSQFRSNSTMTNELSFVERVPVYSNGNNEWTLVDEKNKVVVKAGLIKHSVPCFGYVVQEKDVVGQLSPEKCDQAGVEAIYRKDLKNGKPVVLPNGTVLMPEDVLTPPIKGRKVVICGDTRDSTTIASIAKDCDVLIHECTLGEDERENVNHKEHSCPSVLVSCASALRTKRLVVNHIASQFICTKHRYKTFDGKKFGGKVVKSDGDLYKQIAHLFKREQHLLLARDFDCVSVPAGGYKLETNNFDVRNLEDYNQQ